MSETKRLNVSFDSGLPLGTHGSFTYQGERWIAIPLVKWQRVLNVSDKLIGVLSRARAHLTRHVASHPEQAEWIVPALQVLAADELVREKAEAQTS